MKKLILCGCLVFATISLQAIDCLRSFQIDMENSYTRASSSFEECDRMTFLIGKCYRETVAQLNHNIGEAANGYDDCMNRNGEPLP